MRASELAPVQSQEGCVHPRCDALPPAPGDTHCHVASAEEGGKKVGRKGLEDVPEIGGE